MRTQRPEARWEASPLVLGVGGLSTGLGFLAGGSWATRPSEHARRLGRTPRGLFWLPGANPSSLPGGTARVVGGRAMHSDPPNGKLLISLL